MPTIGPTKPRGERSVEQRLARLLDGPLLERVVPHLAPETLHRLIRRRGLEACGELVAAATPAQLTHLLDIDLWRAERPGRDDRFDADRFAEWLEVLVDTGVSVAARTVAALDPDLVVAGLSRSVRVFDPGIFEPVAQSDDEASDRHSAMRDGDWLEVEAASEEPLEPADAGAPGESPGLEEEIGGYVVRARRGDAWDAIVTLLVALESEHRDGFDRLMAGCRRLSDARPEEDGLDHLLGAPEQHLYDVASQRDERRVRRGYATAADARAFLALARRPWGGRQANPIAAAYLRTADEAAASVASDGVAAAAGAPAAERSRGLDTPLPEPPPAALAEVMALLTEAGIVQEPPRALLRAAEGAAEGPPLAALRRSMAHARDTDESAFLLRGRELAFLANTLLTGGSLRSRPFTPRTATDAAGAICNLGLELWPSRWPRATSSQARGAGSTSAPPSLLVDHDLVTAFEVGWRTLYREVSLFTAESLLATLRDVGSTDREVRRGLVRLRRALGAQRDAGTPWRARDATEVLALLDRRVWMGVRALLDECPVLPAAVASFLENRASGDRPGAFEFISTAAQIGDVHAFLRKIAEVLTHR